ncbi:aquaporin, partial [Rhizobium ruizarguesonis]
ILVVLITILGPISGAHFNPFVSLVFALRRELPASSVPAYIASQIVGGIAGTMLAHALFELFGFFLPLDVAVGKIVRGITGQQ